MAQLMFTRRLSSLLLYKNGLEAINNQYVARSHGQQLLIKVGSCSLTTDASGHELEKQWADADTFGVLDERFQEKHSTKSFEDGPKRKDSKKMKRPAKFQSAERVIGQFDDDDGRRGMFGDIQSKSFDDGFEEERNSNVRKIVMDKASLPIRERKKMAGESEVFGSLDRKLPKFRDHRGEYLTSANTGVLKHDKQDELEMYYPARETRMMPEDYAAKMLNFIKEHKLKDALELLDQMKEDRVQPTKRIYNILINGCGQVGFTTMAFRLYKQLRDRAMAPSDATYTGLFNACANSPWDDGLRRAEKVRNKMKELGHVQNVIHYHVMMKAFGRCKDLHTVFALADEMAAKKLKLTDETLSFMLMACAEDKETGFRFAIEAWRKFRLKRISSSIYTYNLLLRVVRDCGAGKSELVNELLTPDAAIGSPSPKPLLFPGDDPSQQLECEHGSDVRLPSERTLLTLQPAREPDQVEVLTVEESRKKLVPSSSNSNGAVIPDLLSPDVSSGNIMALQSLDTAENRLRALGGPMGILSRMAKDHVKPNIKTFSLLLETLPSSNEAEESLIALIDQHKVKLDIDFFNILIKKRNSRRDAESAKDVLRIIQQRGLIPDIFTYGALALGCSQEEQANELLQHLEDIQCRPNIEIMGALVSRGLFRKDWLYVKSMLKVMQKNEIQPSILLLRHLETTIDDARKIALKVERGMDVLDRFKTEKYKKHFKVFMFFYKDWLKTMKLDYYDDPMKAYRPHVGDDDEVENDESFKDSATELKS